MPWHAGGDRLERLHQLVRHIADRPGAPVAVGHIVVGLEHQEPGEAAIDHRALLQRCQERLRYGRGVDAAAGLGDVLARPLLLVRVLGAEEAAAGAGVELGQDVTRETAAR
jgi:hypothetical protein